MAKDDYFVIVFQVLKYLYDCLKRGESPKIGSLNAEKLGLEEKYWQYVLRNLYTEGYIEGVSLFNALGVPDPGVKIQRNFGITPKGIQYLSENSMLAKAKEFAKDLIDIIT